MKIIRTDPNKNPNQNCNSVSSAICIVFDKGYAKNNYILFGAAINVRPFLRIIRGKKPTSSATMKTHTHTESLKWHSMNDLKWRKW